MLLNLSPELITTYEAEIAKWASPATLKRKKASLAKFFNWAKQEGHLKKNPLEKVPQAVQVPKAPQAKNFLKVGLVGGLAGLTFLLVAKVKLPIHFFPAPAQEEKRGQTTTPTGQKSPEPMANIQSPTLLSPWTIYTKLNLKSVVSETVSSQTITFKLYNNENETTPLWTSEPKTLIPDVNGDILISLANVPTELFLENEKLFLGTDLTSVKIPISTANTAANVGGFYPADPEEGAKANTIPIISADGSLILASESPAIKAKEGNLLIEGQALTLTTPISSDGDITLAPGGSGEIDLLSNLKIQDANLVSGSLISGSVRNNFSNYDLINLSSGSTPVERFSVDALGNTYIGGSLSIKTLNAQSISTKGYSQTEGNLSVIQKGTALNDLVTLTLDERNKPYDRNSIYSTLVLKRYDGAVEGAALYVDEGNAIFDGQLRLGRYVSNPTAIGQGSLVYNSSDTTVYIWNGSSWVALGGGSTAGFWQRNLGALSPSNITDDVLVGGTATASALIRLPGLNNQDVWFNLGIGNVGIGTTAPAGPLHILLASTPGEKPFRIEAGTTAAPRIDLFSNNETSTSRNWTIRTDSANYGDFSIMQSTARLGDPGVAGTTRLYISSTGNVGIGTTSPGSKLEVENTASADDVLLLEDSSGLCEAQPTTTGLTWSCSSDVRLKTDITSASSVLKYITDIPLRDYTVIKTGERVMGPTAQEMQLIHPELVTMGDDGYLQISELTPWQIVKGIQELNTRIDNFTLTDTGDLNIEKVAGTDTYNVRNTKDNNLITRAGAFGSAIIGYIKAGLIETQELVSPVVQTKFISPLPDESDVIIQIGRKTPSSAPSTSLRTTEGQASGFGELIIKDATGSAVASISSSGDATFSGELHASKIYANEIRSTTIDDIQKLLRKVETDQGLLSQAATWNTNTATTSTALSASISAQLTVNDLFVINQAAIYSLSVSTSITVGSDLVFSLNTINTLTSPLSLQSLALAPVEIMAGKIRIETNGDVKIQGNVAIAGNLEVGGTTKLKDLTTEKIIIASESNSATPSGQITAGEIQTNATAGKATLPGGSTELTINSPHVGASSLIYVTPTSTTNNNVLYVKSKEAGKFVVGFTDPINIDVSFNWWIIETQ